ncbi:E3 SUMO-protein ligase nse2 [Curvularia clavata]|uniref:Telomeric repeat-binding factor 2-interacting protein 1 n=1 Tax=Curvularia clavata TaxID=95742 RepID=A0A9Q9DV73_CURCL|nr:E3 SUMO-protein ligase nse2 [Curvularia clavata]
MAAPVVYKDVADASKLGFSGKLFSGKKFWVAQRVPARNQLLEDIKANGGEVVPLEKKADYLIADHFRRDAPPGSVSYEFVEKSIKQGELRDPQDHPAGPPLGEAREPGATHQPTKSGRAAYTAEEDRILYNWTRDAEARGDSVSGNEIYKKLGEKYPRHTWQSWRDRYLKQLRHRPPSAFKKPDNAPPSPPSDQPNERMPPAPSSFKPLEQQTSKKGQTTTAIKHDYSVHDLEITFDEEDWQELYAFADLIDSHRGTERYDSAWEEWAKSQGKTAEQWRQYFEKVVHPQWLRDTEYKRERIKRRVEKKHEVEEDVTPSQPIDEVFSQISQPEEEEEADSDFDERFEALISDNSNRGIPAGYRFYALEKKQQTLDAQPGRGATALHIHLLRQWNSLSEEEQAPYIAMGKRTATIALEQAKNSARTASLPRAVSPPAAQPESPESSVEVQGKSIKRSREAEEAEEQDEDIAASRSIKRRKSGSATPTNDGTLETSTEMFGTQEQPLEISSPESSQDMIQPEAAPGQTGQDMSDIAEDDEATMVELDEQSADKEVESIESDVFPDIDGSPQPPAGYETNLEDELPSNTPTPRATHQKELNFDIEAILASPTKDKFPQSFDLADDAKFRQELLFPTSQIPGSDASTQQSMEEYRRSLQEEDLAQPGYSQYQPAPLRLSSSPAPSIASSNSTNSGDPDPPLNAKEIIEFYDEQNAQGYPNDFISAALKRTGLRPELAVKVLDAWKEGKPLPNERGIWSKEDDADVESGDGLALAKLYRKHTTDGWGGVTERMGRSVNDVKKHSKQAVTEIIAAAENVNDKLRDHAEYIARRKKKWDAGKNVEGRDLEERTMEELQLKVDEATAKLEESMRAVIDSGIAAQRIDETLEWLKTNAPTTLDQEYRTQMTQREMLRQSQSQVDSQRRRTQNVDGDGDTEMDNGPTPGPTPLDGSRIALTGASELFASRMQRQKDVYTSLSLTARYARNNDYRDFKRIVHDAKYGDDGPVLGHEDAWFTESGSPAPGITDSTQRGEFDDDDIVVDRANISTRCPITYQQFKEPYSSSKCPHTFEKNAILEMIRRGPHRIGQQKAVDCPVTGCNQMLTENDVSSNKVLIRKIRRMQEAELAEAEESSDDEIQASRSDMPTQLAPSSNAGNEAEASDSDGEISA